MTLTDFVYEIGEPPYEIWRQRAVRVVGFADTGSQFTFIRHLTNLTDVPLTGFKTNVSGTHVTSSSIVEGSAWATGPPEVYYNDDGDIELTWVDPILVGESFTFQFDIYNARPLTFMVFDTTIP